MQIQTAGFAPPPQSQLGNSNPDAIPGGILKELLASGLLGRYATLAKAGMLYIAQANISAPVAYTNPTGVGGPLLWNRPGSNRDAHILGVALGVSVVTTVAGSVGLTGNVGQSAAPTTTTAIDGKSSGLIGGADGAVEAYRIGTVVNAGNFFLPCFHVHTGALTVDNFGQAYRDLGAPLIVPPGGWAALAGSAALTTLAGIAAIVYAEVPA